MKGILYGGGYDQRGGNQMRGGPFQNDNRGGRFQNNDRGGGYSNHGNRQQQMGGFHDNQQMGGRQQIRGGVFPNDQRRRGGDFPNGPGMGRGHFQNNRSGAGGGFADDRRRAGGGFPNGQPMGQPRFRRPDGLSFDGVNNPNAPPPVQRNGRPRELSLHEQAVLESPPHYRTALNQMHSGPVSDREVLAQKDKQNSYMASLNEQIRLKQERKRKEKMKQEEEDRKLEARIQRQRMRRERRYSKDAASRVYPQNGGRGAPPGGGAFGSPAGASPGRGPWGGDPFGRGGGPPGGGNPFGRGGGPPGGGSPFGRGGGPPGGGSPFGRGGGPPGGGNPFGGGGPPWGGGHFGRGGGPPGGGSPFGRGGGGGGPWDSGPNNSGSPWGGGRGVSPHMGGSPRRHANMTSEERQRVAAEQQRNLFAAREADAQRKRQERELAKRQEEEREARDNARLRRQQMDMANRAPAASSRYDYDALRRENERQAAEIKRRKEEELKKKLEADRRDEMRLKREREQLAAKQEEDKKQEAFKKLQAENAALAAEKKRLAEEKARKEKEEEEKDRIRLERQRQELAERNKQQTPKPAVATTPKAETPKRAPVGSKSRRDLFGGDKPKKPVLKHDPWADSLEQEFNKVNQSRPPPEDAIQVLTRQMEKEKGLRIAAEDELIKLRSTSYLEGASEFMTASTSSASPVNKLTVKPGSLAHHGMRLLSAAFSPVADELIEDTETEALTALQRAQQRLKRLELLGDRHPSGDQLDLLLNEEEEQSRPHLESHADFIPIDEDIGAISRPRRSRVGAVDLT